MTFTARRSRSFGGDQPSRGRNIVAGGYPRQRKSLKGLQKSDYSGINGFRSGGAIGDSCLTQDLRPGPHSVALRGFGRPGEPKLLRLCFHRLHVNHLCFGILAAGNLYLHPRKLLGFVLVIQTENVVL